MLSHDLLEMLRCPHCVSGSTRAPGDDPGVLQLLHDTWLICTQPGCDRKYPIVDGIPDLRPETGERWRATPVDQLPLKPAWS